MGVRDTGGTIDGVRFIGSGVRLNTPVNANVMTMTPTSRKNINTMAIIWSVVSFLTDLFGASD